MERHTVVLLFEKEKSSNTKQILFLNLLYFKGYLLFVMSPTYLVFIISMIYEKNKIWYWKGFELVSQASNPDTLPLDYYI